MFDAKTIDHDGEGYNSSYQKQQSKYMEMI
jgi:hypothetical protein